MALMPLTLSWADVSARLAATVFAGALIGLNRGESGKAAGLRTTLLVCLAACLAMLQVNALLAQAGKQPGSFAVLDLMRLPLGILSGVGFIGGGAILRQGGSVRGVTTAATLWFVTVIGLCFGGGQLGLGFSGLVLALVVLWLLKAVERRVMREHTLTLHVIYDPHAFSRQDFRETLSGHSCELFSQSARLREADGRKEEWFEVRWRARADPDDVPPLVELARDAGALEATWAMKR